MHITATTVVPTTTTVITAPAPMVPINILAVVLVDVLEPVFAPPTTATMQAVTTTTVSISVTITIATFAPTGWSPSTTSVPMVVIPREPVPTVDVPVVGPQVIATVQETPAMYARPRRPAMVHMPHTPVPTVVIHTALR